MTTPTPRRSLAPDLARGIMLLAIALAHTPAFIADHSHGWKPLNDTVEFISTMLVTDQARPMFVFLFGYGLTQLATSRQRRGDDQPAIRRLIRRRGLTLVLIGFTHAVLTMPLDIVAVYGIASIIFVKLVHAEPATLKRAAAITAIPVVVATGGVATWGLLTGTTAYGPKSIVPMHDTYLDAVLNHATNWPIGVLAAGAVILPALFLGILAGRSRILDEPHRHIDTLRRSSLGLVAVALAGKLPAALILIDVWDAPTWVRIATGAIYPFAGYAGGIGMALLIGYISVLIGEQRGPATLAISGLGQRSLTFYLFQSVVFVTLFFPYTLDLSGRVGFGGAGLIAVGIWLVSLALSEIFRRNNYRGPAENLLRRLARPKPAPQPVT